MVITVSCPSCATSFPVDPNKIPEAGVKVRCSQCAHVFRVERPTPEPEVETPVAAEPEVESPIPAEPEVETPVAAEPEDQALERDPFAEASSAGAPPDADATVEVAESGREPSSSGDLPDWARGADTGPTTEEPEAPWSGAASEPDLPAPTSEAGLGAPTSEPVERSEPRLTEEVEAPEAEGWTAQVEEQPEAALPEAPEPEAALPEAPEPEAALPEAPELEAALPEAPEPEAALPPVETEAERGLPEVEHASALPEATEEIVESLPEPEPSLHGTPAPSLEPEPIPEPTPYDPGSVAEPEETEPAAAEAQPEAPPVQGFTFGKRDPMDKARRLARVLVSDMVMYNADRHRAALAQGTLEEDFEEEIDKSWKEYVDQVGEDLAEGEGKQFWTQALNDILAKGQKVF